MNFPCEVGLKSNQKVGLVYNHLYYYCTSWYSLPGTSSVKQGGATAELGPLVVISSAILVASSGTTKGKERDDPDTTGARWKGGDSSDPTGARWKGGDTCSS